MISCKQGNGTADALTIKNGVEFQAMNLFSHNLRFQGFCGSRMNSFLPSQQSIVSRRSAVRRPSTNQRQLGFSLVEMMVVVSIIVILTAISIPSVMTITRNYRISGDARSISAALNLARMRAASDFTHARVYLNLSGNTYHLEVWNKASGCWQTDGDSNACTQTTSPVTPLAQNDAFGFGSLTTGPTAATSAIAQAPACTSGVAGASAGSNIASTACIEFNSRTYPVNSTNTIVASDAIYITNNLQLYSAIAVSISGQPTAYSYGGSAWSPF
jgi:prepilin-type N-terminal cleavage/methylation domain-containing protein